MKYIATFHTHLSAMLSERAFKREKVNCRLIPVPRALSSSCGTALEYCGAPRLELLDIDAERVYEAGEHGYKIIFGNE